ncbi:phasin family protein [Megalodesulfovibrio paquesii]
MLPKDLLYIGLGAAYMAKDKMDDLLSDLEERGKLSREEAEKFLDDAKERAAKERSDLEASIKGALREAVADLGLATKEDIESLKKLIKAKG